ncbi:MAG TPA: hypothetical protein DCR69_05025 [Clostridium sp.]|nr:hypothetical protein [Clostridium sp.]
MKQDYKNNINTLSKIGTEKLSIYYTINDNETFIEWGTLKHTISNSMYKGILKEFLVNEHEWYSLGASMTNPTEGGLGLFIKNNSMRIINRTLSPRYASLIAAIMYNEGWIDYKGKKSIKIRKI